MSKKEMIDDLRSSIRLEKIKAENPDMEVFAIDHFGVRTIYKVGKINIADGAGEGPQLPREALERPREIPGKPDPPQRAEEQVQPTNGAGQWRDLAELAKEKRDREELEAKRREYGGHEYDPLARN